MKKIESYRAGTSESSREEREEAHRTFNAPLARRINGELTEPSTTGRHDAVKGNTAGKSVTVTFQKAGTATRVATGLPYTVHNYRVIRSSVPCKIGDSGRRHDRGVLWLESDVAPVTVDLVAFGERRPEPPTPWRKSVGTRRPVL